MNEIEFFPTLPGRLRLYRETIPPLKEREILGGYAVRKLNRMIATQEAFIMPAKSQKTGKKASGYDVTFVNFKLAGETKERFGAYLSEGVDVHSKDIQSLISSGIKFSFSENRENGVAMASATCRDEGNINDGHCITSRSNDWYEALVMCVFKVHELGLDESWVDQSGSDDWG